MKKIGRPLKFQSVKKLQESIDEYFNITPIEMQTVTGLALHLDTTRELLCDYQAKDEFSDTIKRAKARIEHAYELRGMEKGTAFDIFRLKNMGWKDQQNIKHSGGMDNTIAARLSDDDLAAIILGKK